MEGLQLTFAEEHAESERLQVQGRPEGCLNLCSLYQKHRKYIRFCWEGQLYEFLCLCFGLGRAPRIFTKLLKIPIAILRRINIRIIVYLDDMLLMSQTIEGLNMARDTFSVTSTGVHNKSEKISTVGNPETRILGPGNRLSQHDSNSANGKSKTFNSEM